MGGVPKIDIKIFIDILHIDNLIKTLKEGKIGQVDSLKFFIYANDHYPEHVHIMRKSQTLARIKLTNYELMNGSNISKADYRKAVDWLKDKNKGGELIKYFRNNLVESIEVYIYKNNNGEIMYSYTRPSILRG